MSNSFTEIPSKKRLISFIGRHPVEAGQQNILRDLSSRNKSNQINSGFQLQFRYEKMQLEKNNLAEIDV